MNKKYNSGAIAAIIFSPICLILGSIFIAAGTDLHRYIDIMDNAFGPWDKGMTPCLILGIILLFACVGLFIAGIIFLKNNKDNDGK